MAQKLFPPGVEYVPTDWAPGCPICHTVHTQPDLAVECMVKCISGITGIMTLSGSYILIPGTLESGRVNVVTMPKTHLMLEMDVSVETVAQGERFDAAITITPAAAAGFPVSLMYQGRLRDVHIPDDRQQLVFEGVTYTKMMLSENGTSYRLTVWVDLASM